MNLQISRKPGSKRPSVSTTHSPSWQPRPLCNGITLRTDTALRVILRLGRRRVGIWGLESGIWRPNPARIRIFDGIQIFRNFMFFGHPLRGPLVASFSVPVHSQNLSFGMRLSTNTLLAWKIAGSQFEFTGFGKIGLKEAKRSNHTRPKLTAKVPLQRNYSSNPNCSTSYIEVGPATGEHLGFGKQLQMPKSGQNSNFHRFCDSRKFVFFRPSLVNLCAR